ncbi:MAG: PAS domain S-box protein [Proteobacteria bacterium]|nr:PAS domain S-box protein [Pseudomonadota bacterium]
MGTDDIKENEQQRRMLQEYIFSLEDVQEKAEELAGAHEKLKQSQDFLIAVLDSTTHGICLVKNHTFIWCNNAFADILGWNQEDMIGQKSNIIFHDEEEHANIDRIIYNNPLKDRMLTYEYDFMHKDGHRVSCMVKGRPQDEHDLSKGYVFSVTDFTELKKTETALKNAYKELEGRTKDLLEANVNLNREIKDHKKTEDKLNQYRAHLEDLVMKRTAELKETNEKLQQEISERNQQEEALNKLKELESSMLGAIPHAVIGLKERIVIFANDSVEEVFGWKPEELIGKRTRTLYRTDADYEEIGTLYQVLEKQKVYSMEINCRHKDGRDIICKLNVSRIGTSLAEKHIVVMYEDITDKKRVENALRESEEKYRNIFDNTIEGILQSAPDGRILNANPALVSLYKADSLYELVNDVKNFGKLFVDPLRCEEFQRLLMEQSTVKSFEAELYCKDKNICWVSINARSVLDEDGKLIYYEGTLQDISEHKKLESQLLQSQKMEAIGTLAGGVAHDINNILMGIQGYTSLALFNLKSSHPNYEKLKSIEALVKSGADLTRQLLGFARGGRYEVKPSNINEIVAKTSMMFGRTKKEITIHTQYEEKPYTVDVDQGQIEQALLNLYVNAWQAMPGGGELHIETQNHFFDENNAKASYVKPGEYLKISVTDTGIGMDSKTKERIFEPFFTTKDMGHGTGLGLASVYGIVKNHGGFINVYSEKGHGSTFNIYLPASERAVQKEEAFISDTIKGTETILLVDDEETIIDVNKDFLELLGYSVIAARSGREAIETYKARAETIDLVILDMIMPDIGGAETFEFLKMVNPDVKAILSTGYSINGQATGIINRGCKAFIQKPFTIQTLSQKIREVLDN